MKKNKLEEWFFGDGNCEQPTIEEIEAEIKENIDKKKNAKTSFEKEVYKLKIKVYKKELKNRVR